MILTLQFAMEEREEFAKDEGLHQAITGKLSPDALDLQVLRTILPRNLDIKGHCLIGLLVPRQLLLWMNQYEDFVTLLTRGVNYFPFDGKELLGGRSTTTKV